MFYIHESRGNFTRLREDQGKPVSFKTRQCAESHCMMLRTQYPDWTFCPSERLDPRCEPEELLDEIERECATDDGDCEAAINRIFLECANWIGHGEAQQMIEAQIRYIPEGCHIVEDADGERFVPNS